MVPLTLQEAAALTGHHAWWEQRLFELCGRWTTDAEDATLAVALGGQAQRHAARAEAWHRRLPALAGWEPSELTAPPHPDLAAAVERLGGEATTVRVRLVALSRVLLPARLAAYRAHRVCASPLCDAPAIRVLDAAVAALPAEIDTTGALLDEALGGNDASVAAVERRCRDLLRTS